MYGRRCRIEDEYRDWGRPMLTLQDKFARPAVVVTTMVVGVTGLYYIQNAYPKGGFFRDLLGIAAIALVGSIVAMALEKAALRRYFCTLIVVVAIMLISVCSLKLGLKNVLVECFSATKFAVLNRDPSIPSADPPHYVDVTKDAREYWNNY
jgi:hypothetical protein